MIRRGLPAAVAVGLVTAVAVHPLAGCLPFGDDSLLHLYRLVELDHLLRQAILFPRWMPDLVFGYGYPLLNFYAPLSTYLAEAVYVLAGLSFRDSLATAFGVCLVIAAAGNYRFARDYMSEGPAAFAAAAYVLAPYVLFNTYMRGSLSDALALALFPWVAWTLRRAARGGAAYIAAASATFALLILSHNASSLAFTPVLALLAISYAVNYGRSETGSSSAGPSTLGVPVYRPALHSAMRMLVALVLGLALSAFFWLPALAERGITRLDSFISAPEYDFHGNFLTLAELIIPPEPARAGLLNLSPARSLGAVLAALALVGLGVAIRRRGRGELASTTLALGVALAGLVVMMLPVSVRVWERLPLIRYFQFPWRLLAQSSFVVAFLAAAGVAGVVDGWVSRGRARGSRAAATGNVVKLFPALALLAVGLASLPYLYPYQSCDVPASPTLADVTAYQRDFGTLGVTSAGEYLPAWVREPPHSPPFPGADLGAPLSDKLDAASLPPGAQVLTASGGALWARLRLSLPEPGQVAFHTFFFPGWQARLDGEPAPILALAPMGRIGLELPAGEHELYLSFGGTPARRLGESLSLAGFLAWLVVLAAGLVQAWRAHKGKVRETIQRRGAYLAVIGKRAPRPGAGEDEQDRGTVGEVGLVVLAAAVLLVLKLGWVDRFDSPWRLGFDGQNVPGASSPPAANFGDVLTLLGYRLSTTRAKPGDTVEVTLYWNAPDALARNYGSYAHLIDPMFEMYSQSENSVLDYATNRSWGPATYIEDRHRLIVPPESPAGKYWIEIGAYPSGEGRRLSILDAAGRTLGRQMLLAPIKVFDPVRRAPTPAHPLDVNFQDSARLLGYDLEPEGVVEVPAISDAAAGPPTTLRVTLYWQALDRLSQDYTVFVHLQDPTGRLVAQHDSQPGGGRFPTTFWEPGEFIVDEHILEIATPTAAGTYTLTAGIYLPQTGERLAVHSPRELAEGDAARLGEVAIAEPSR